MQPICFAGQAAGGRASNARPYAIDLCSDHARRGDHWSFFSEALLYCAETSVASARQEGAQETGGNGRAMLAPTL